MSEGLLLLLLWVGFWVSLYLMFQEDQFRSLVGFNVFSTVVNLVIFTGGYNFTRNVAIVPPGLTEPRSAVADPLPQALILTAIVIGFGFVAFLAFMVERLLSGQFEHPEDSVGPTFLRDDLENDSKTLASG